MTFNMAIKFPLVYWKQWNIEFGKLIDANGRRCIGYRVAV